MKATKTILTGLSFVVCFLFLFIRNPYYEPSSISIAGNYDKPVEAVISWDTGRGFNQDESVTVILGRHIPLPPGSHRITIMRSSSRNKESKDTQVWIKSISTDRVSLSLNSFQIPGTAELRTNSSDNSRWLALSKQSQPITFDSDFSMLTISFLKSESSGRVIVSVDGLQTIYDLYSPIPEIKTISVNSRFIPGTDASTTSLPQLPFSAISIKTTEALNPDSISIVKEKDRIALPVKNEGDEFNLADLNLKTRHIHPLLLMVQIVISVLFALIVRFVYESKSSLMALAEPSVLKLRLLDGHRWVFLVLFAVAMITFSLWLLAFWPGAMTSDSLDQWTQARTLHFSNWHPFVNAIIYVFFMQIADSPALIALAQLTLMAAIGSFIFYFAIRHGVSVYIVAPFYALFILSIPNGLYSITLWKDVAFSLLSVLFAFAVFYLKYRKDQGVCFDISVRKILLVSMIFTVLCLLRHNGVIYLIALPVFLYTFRLLSVRKASLFTLTTIVLYVLVNWVAGGALGVHKNTDYERLDLTWKLNPIIALFASPIAYYSDNYESDKAVVQDVLKTNDIKSLYYPSNFGFTFYTQIAGKDIDSQKLDRLRSLYNSRIPENIPIFMADRSTMFFSALGSAHSILWSNELFKVPRDRDFKGSETARLRIHPKSAALSKFLYGIAASSFEYSGLKRGRFIFWNALPSLILLIALCACYKWIPATALSVLFILVQLVPLIVVMPAAEFRFIYFIYLYSFFAVPLAAVELRGRLKGSSRGRSTIRPGLDIA